jgi:hypothetical protein
MSARTAPLQARIVKPDEASPLKAFGLDLKVLLTTLPGGQDQYFKAMAELVPGDDFAGDTHFAGAH